MVDVINNIKYIVSFFYLVLCYLLMNLVILFFGRLIDVEVR